MTDAMRPQEGMATELRRTIRADSTELPVISTSSLRVDADLWVGDEIVRCTGMTATTLTGCARGLRREDGGAEAQTWLGGTPVVQMGWDTTEGLATLPAVATEGRSVEVGGVNYYGQNRGDGTIVWVALNDATFDAGTMAIVGGVITLPRIPPNIAIIYLTADTEAAASADDLDSVTPTGSLGDGTLLIVRQAAGGRDVTIRSTAGPSSGNIWLQSNNLLDYTLDTAIRRIVFAWDGAQGDWVEVTRSRSHINDLVGIYIDAFVANNDILVYNAALNTFMNMAPPAPYTDEQVRDVIGAAIVAGAGIDVTVADGADTITIATTQPKIIMLRTAESTAVSNTCNNILAATTELTLNGNVGWWRVKADLTKYTDFRVGVHMISGAAGARLRAEFSTDETTWTPLGTAADEGQSLVLGTVGVRTPAAFSAIRGAAKADVFLRLVTNGGNGTDDPQFGNCWVEVR